MLSKSMHYTTSMNSSRNENSAGEEISALVIEDDLFFQNVITEALKSCTKSIKAWLASSGQEAWSIIRKESPGFQLVLVELGLPDSDGIDLIRSLKSQWPNLTVMVVSTSNDRKRVLQAIKAGASGYIVKGDVHLTITHAINLALAGIHPMSPELNAYLVQHVRSQGNAFLKADLGLTSREYELLDYFAHGHSYKRCAELMGVSLSTIQSHTRNLFRKLGVRSSLQAVLKAKGDE
jgi:DNA-binding NarL/FixJ family response regulator